MSFGQTVAADMELGLEASPPCPNEPYGRTCAELHPADERHWCRRCAFGAAVWAWAVELSR